MNAQQANEIKIGQMLTPKPLWNKTERVRKLPEKTEVLDVRKERNCQTGVMVKVCALNGQIYWLSAGWFDL